jgi:hypothetical protein
VYTYCRCKVREHKTIIHNLERNQRRIKVYCRCKVRAHKTIIGNLERNQRRIKVCIVDKRYVIRSVEVFTHFPAPKKITYFNIEAHILLLKKANA